MQIIRRYKKLQLITAANKNKYYISDQVNWNRDTSVQIFEKTKIISKKDPSFFITNRIHFINYILDLIQNNNFQLAKQVSQQISYEKIAEWNLLYKIGTSISNLLHSKTFKQQQVCKKKQILQLMRSFKYQPNLDKDKDLYQYIKMESKDIITSVYAEYLMGVFPDLFKPYQQTLQKMAIESMSDDKNWIIYNGFISDFWSEQFKQNLRQLKHKDRKIEIFLNFEDKNKQKQFIKNRKQIIKRSATQQKIGDILRDLGYNFIQNCFIKGIQIDFAFPPNFVLEYNGIFHYNIGSSEPSPLQYQKWKKIKFDQINLQRIVIPFYQWEKYMNEKAQRAYLIEKIQFSILQKQIGVKQNQKIKEMYKNRKPIIQ